MKWLSSQVNNLAVLWRKRNHLTPKPVPNAMSVHSQMLPVNCSAAGEAAVGIFMTVNDCECVVIVFLPKSVRNTYSGGMLAYFGIYARFCLCAIQAQDAHSLWARMNGLQHGEWHFICWNACQVSHAVIRTYVQKNANTFARGVSEGSEIGIVSSLFVCQYKCSCQIIYPYLRETRSISGRFRWAK